MKKKLLLSFFAILLLFPVISNAKEGLNFSYNEDNNLKKEVNGSSVIIGNEIDNKVNVNGINILLGSKVSDRSISDYAVIIGESVTVSGTYNKDILVIGSEVKIEGQINRDIVVLANIVSINGSLGRDAKIYASKISISDSTVAGTIELRATELNVDEKSSVGRIIYNDNIELNLKKDFNKVSYEVEKKENNKLMTYFTNLVYVLVLYAVLVLVFPRLFDKIKDDKFNISDLLSKIGKGAFLLILGPILILVSFMSAIGVYVGMLAIALYVLLISLSFIISSYYVGYVIWNKLIKKEENNLLIGFIGIVLLDIVSLIPVVNIIVILLGLGLSLKYIEKK